MLNVGAVREPPLQDMLLTPQNLKAPLFLKLGVKHTVKKTIAE